MIRHGRQNSKLCNIDVPLSEAGREQAKLLAFRIKGWGIEEIYSSDLIRAVETADIINQTLHVKRNLSPLLREIDFGKMTGRSDEENKCLFEGFLDELDQMQWDLSYPGGECGAEVFHRGMLVIQQIAKFQADSVAIVTHGGLIRSVLAGILGIDFAKKRMLGRNLENTGITELMYDSKKDRYTLERFNDYAHLEKSPCLLRQTWVERDSK